eukprot:7371960-Pyramimonas_sp.AAC.1
MTMIARREDKEGEGRKMAGVLKVPGPTAHRRQAVLALIGAPDRPSSPRLDSPRARPGRDAILGAARPNRRARGGGHPPP